MNMKLLLMLLPAWALAACAMAESTLFDVGTGDGSGECHSTAGLYHLSKSTIRIKVNEFIDQTGVGDFYIDKVESRVKPDPHHVYCLDFLASPTSVDTFLVKKSNGLLEKISSEAKDQSVEIAKTLIKTLFVGLSGNPQFDERLTQARSFGLPPRLGSTLRFEAEFDPFNKPQVAMINDALNDFGFCLVLDGQAFDDRHEDIDSYCDHPTRRKRRTAQLTKASTMEALRPAKPGGRGIFYRPRQPYKYYLFAKRNRQVSGGWQLRGTETVYFENNSPIFSIAIDRTFFAERKTTLVFDNGALRDVEITKDSELAGFVQIPLTVAQSIAALPANIIQVRIDATNNRNALIKAQSELLAAERRRSERLLQLRGLQPAGSQNRSLDPRFNGATRDVQSIDGNANRALTLTGVPSHDQCMIDCSKSESDGAICNKFCGCMISCAPSGDQTSCKRVCARGGAG